MSEARGERQIPDTSVGLELANGMRDVLSDPTMNGLVPEQGNEPESAINLTAFRAGTLFLQGVPYYRVVVETRGATCYYMRLRDPNWGYDFFPTAYLDNEGRGYAAGFLPEELADWGLSLSEFLLYVLQHTDFNVIDTKIYEQKLREDLEETARILGKVRERQ